MQKSSQQPLSLAAIALLCFAVPGALLDTAEATDLGAGNAAVQKAFQAYQAGGHRVPAKPKGPRKADAPKRVMITGFGLFSGVTYNISGVVAASMANPKFWPGVTKLGALAKAPQQADVAAGTLTKKDGGARAWSRSLTIDGQRYEVCILVLDVLWDLGGAITLWEAAHFGPDLILMTGRGGPKAVFEAGSLNKAIPYSGFVADGRADPANKPVKGAVFDPKLPGVEAAIQMTWNNKALAEAVRPLVAKIGKGHEVVAAPGARPRNTYICNNISCVVLHGLKGQPVKLAGGAITLKTAGLDKTTAGFFHYPAAATNQADEVLGWARVLATAIQTHFKADAKAAKARTAPGKADPQPKETDGR